MDMPEPNFRDNRTCWVPIAHISAKIRMMAVFSPIAKGLYELIPQRYLSRISLVELINEYAMNGDAIHATVTTLLWGVPVDEKLSPTLRDRSRLFNANPRNGGRTLTYIRFGVFALTRSRGFNAHHDFLVSGLVTSLIFE